jgi:hypothetical protein
MTTHDLAHFEQAVRKMSVLLDALLSSPKHRVADHPTVPNTPGIYLWSPPELRGD